MMRLPALTATFLGAGLATGIALTLGSQAIADRPLAKTQQGPDQFNYLGAGVGAFGLAIGGATVGARAGSGAVGTTAVFSGLVGAAAGGYLAAPSIRRYLDER